MTVMPREWAFMFFAQVGQALGKPVQTRFPVSSEREGTELWAHATHSTQKM